jgi:hypothetical protein
LEVTANEDLHDYSCNDLFFIKYYQGDQIKEDEVSGHAALMRKIRNSNKNLAERLEDK